MRWFLSISVAFFLHLDAVLNFVYLVPGSVVTDRLRESIHQVRLLHPKSSVYLLTETKLFQALDQGRIVFEDEVVPVSLNTLPKEQIAPLTPLTKTLQCIDAFISTSNLDQIVYLDETEFLYQSLDPFFCAVSDRVYIPGQFDPEAQPSFLYIPHRQALHEFMYKGRRPGSLPTHDAPQDSQLIFDSGDSVERFFERDVFHIHVQGKRYMRFFRDERGYKRYYLQSGNRKLLYANLRLHSIDFTKAKMRIPFVVRTEFSTATPYLSGDTFRSFATKVYDDAIRCNGEDIQAGDVVFIRGDFLEAFLGLEFPKVTNPFIAIIHNSDETADERIVPLIESPLVKRVFAQNLVYRHPKAIHIPIGIANSFFDLSDKERLERIQRFSPDQHMKKKRMLISFYKTTPPSLRNIVHDTLRPLSFTDQITKRCRPDKFLAIMSDYLYIASPIGAGLDCYRTWEALYLGCIPVVEKNGLSPIFEKLPCIEIDSWDEVTEDFLNQSYNELMKKEFKYEKMYAPYWKKRIEEARLECIHQ